MKSFALHLVVVFIIGAQYHRIWSFCSSTGHDRLNASSNSTLEATKTPRTIQRVIAGHLQHPTEKRITVDASNNTQLSKIYFRRKPNEIRRSNRLRKNTTVLKPVESSTLPDDDIYKDSALLEDVDDNWDSGILRLSAGAGKENHQKGKKKDDNKKTLSDQVKDGKYGLIERELFQEVPTRPGIISYLPNKEVPNDNENNFGGLKKEDIWLAEDHLLVLKGGGLNDEDQNEPWLPIDDYHAPNRQIKIPSNPKVPPPFPVQFEDNGPIQFIGDHKFPFFYPNSNDSLQVFPENGYISPETSSDNEKNLFARTRPSQNVTNGKDDYDYPPPFPPWLFNNETFSNPFLNFGPPPSPGSGPQFPFLPFDSSNGTDYIDEDDPSLYYPPPYSFVYKSNYSSRVPPGPLVPGIVLPPPPNAFARLEAPPSRTSSKEVPFRQILTKITEQKPTVTTTTTTTTESSRITTTTTTEAPKVKQFFYIRQRPTVKDRPRPYTPPSTTPFTPPPITPTSAPEIISFVPKVITTTSTLTDGNPIYYEYFDARKVKQDYKPQSVTTPRPTFKHYPTQQTFPTPIFKEITTTTRRPQVVQSQRPNKIYIQPKPFNYDDYLYITPKPEIRPNGISSNYIPSGGPRPYKAAPDFDREVDSIRQTLQYFKKQQLQQTQTHRTPKTQAVYEYSFDATAPRNNPNRIFNPPAHLDQEPFKPMVQYSRPVNDVNGFRAITHQAESPRLQLRVGDNIYNQSPGTTTSSRPIDYSSRDQRKYVQRPFQNIQYTTPKTTYLSNKPWFSIEKQIVQEVPQTSRGPDSANYQYSTSTGQIPFQGYHYSKPATQRPNHRYQQYRTEIPFNNHINSIRTQLQNYQTLPISLENDTNINNLPGRVLNPDAEIIHLQRHEPFQQQRLAPFRYQQYNNNNNGQIAAPKQFNTIKAPVFDYQHLPVSLQNDTNINYTPGRTLHPDAEIFQFQRREQFQQQRLPPVSLERDTYVNYQFPRPPINPNSEYIGPPNRTPSPSQYRQPPPPPPPFHGGQNGQIGGGIYYFSPAQRDVRYKKA